MTRRLRWLYGAIAVLIIAIILTAIIPVRTGDLGSHRRTPLDYASAIAEIGEHHVNEDASVAPGGQSILLAHGRRTSVAVLLLHGFTNSPRQFDSLGRVLYAEGDNVYIPRLPYHGIRGHGAAPLARITAEILCAAADSAMDLTSALGDTVVVVGLSLGGTMAAWIAEFRPDASRVVIIAPLMALARVPSSLDLALVDLLVRLPNYTNRQNQDRNQADRELGWSTHAIGQILRLGLAVNRASEQRPASSHSIAILLNGGDRTIATAPVLAVARRWNAAGASVRMYRLSAALGLPHDVIDPRQPVRRTDIVYPAIVALVHGAQPAHGDSEMIGDGHAPLHPLR